MPLRKAVYWSIFWISLSLLFNLAVYVAFGHQKALEFLTGYLIEKSLSVDNLFVFLIIFKMFGVDLKDQRRVLNWGIIGVLILRGVLILLGAVLVDQFHWILYLFGILLVFAGYQVMFGHDREIHPEKNFVVRLFRKIMPVDNNIHGHHFFIKEGIHWVATPLFICLIVIETTDVVFAIDSIPAIFAITTDPLIVLSSNIMAVLGLRSLYFVLVEVQSSFSYVKYGVGIVLGYIGVKMLLTDIYHIDTLVSLGIVGVILTISIIFSIFTRSHRSK